MAAAWGSGSPHEGGQPRAAAFWGRRPPEVEPRGSGPAPAAPTPPTAGRRSSKSRRCAPARSGSAARSTATASREVLLRKLESSALSSPRAADSTDRPAKLPEVTGPAAVRRGSPVPLSPCLAAGPAAPAARRCPEPALGLLASGQPPGPARAPRGPSRSSPPPPPLAERGACEDAICPTERPRSRGRYLLATRLAGSRGRPLGSSVAAVSSQQERPRQPGCRRRRGCRCAPSGLEARRHRARLRQRPLPTNGDRKNQRHAGG